MPSLTRTRSVTAHLTPEEHLAVSRAAAQRGCSPSEYARRQLLASAVLSPETRFLGAELLAFRETFLALIVSSLRGESITDQSLAAVRSRFDSIKYSLVERAVQKANSLE